MPRRPAVYSFGSMTVGSAAGRQRRCAVDTAPENLCGSKLLRVVVCQGKTLKMQAGSIFAPILAISWSVGLGQMGKAGPFKSQGIIWGLETCLSFACVLLRLSHCGWRRAPALPKLARDQRKIPARSSALLPAV